MTKLDENDLVEYQMFASLASALGLLGVLLSAFYFFAIALGLGFIAVMLFLGALDTF
mgnify:FL=1|tara:strand:- start:167 stop:337 length:171 start_codon:yes stop_codon:yes gene_type:complete